MTDDGARAVPRRVAVVGAGMAGLASAWFLQEHGVEVTVLERDRVAAGASWGNGGWLLAGDAGPLPSPGTLAYGLRAFASPRSALYVPLRPDPALLRFLVVFARNCTAARWAQSMRAMVPVTAMALDAYDLLADGGVDASTVRTDPHLASFLSIGERDAFLAELEHFRAFGQVVEAEPLTGDEARSANPVLSTAVAGAVALLGQRYLDPGVFVDSLADSVVMRGGELRTGVDVRATRASPSSVEVVSRQSGGSTSESFDAVVVATGAWLGELVGAHGVTVPVQSGRGYSFSVPSSVEVPGPVYLPVQKVACTPIGGRLRLAGTMEFRPPTAPPDPRRIGAIVAAAQPLLTNVDLDDRQDEWVGCRPMTADGLPLAGPTRSPRVWCVGGHGMEGMLLGPVTGRLLAEGLATGRVPDVLRPFDPLR